MAVVQIIRVHVEGTYPTHEAISAYEWSQAGNTGKWTKPQGVDYTRRNPSNVITSGGAAVGVVDNGGAPYLRSHANGTWTDNLLSLPRF